MSGPKQRHCGNNEAGPSPHVILAVASAGTVVGTELGRVVHGMINANYHVHTVVWLVSEPDWRMREVVSRHRMNELPLEVSTHER